MKISEISIVAVQPSEIIIIHSEFTVLNKVKVQYKKIRANLYYLLPQCIHNVNLERI